VSSSSTLVEEELTRVAAHFAPPAYESLPDVDSGHVQPLADKRAFSRWVERNVNAHRVPGYAAVTLSLKKTGVPPGDVTSGQMDFIADLAERYSFGELRVSHEQNLILADVAKRDLYRLWLDAKSGGLATPNIGLLTNIIACPGGDFCSLANAKSIPIAEAIQRRFDDLDYLHDIGELDLNISGCMNSCGHHHVGHIGVLGVDKNGSEWYQVTIGGAQGNDARLGQVIGPSFAAHEMPDVVERLVAAYLDVRREDERFVDTVHRLGVAPFKARVYGDRPREVAHG
jgi:sulfite reductase (NADPH) hemoprotein beta-component